MFKRNTRSGKILAILLIASSLFAGCDDDPATLGFDILPSEDLITAEVKIEFPEVTNVISERIISQGPTESSFAILGYFNDPRFGSTKADFVTEVSLVEDRAAFKADKNYAIDSLVLTFSYSYLNWVGDSLARHNVKIYELNSKLNPLDVFYSNTSMEGRFYQQVIGEKTWYAYDNVADAKWKTKGYLHKTSIKLRDEVANKILNFSTKDLAHRDSLKNVFHGFYVTLDDSSNPEKFNSLLKINLRETSSNLTLYYHEKIIDAVTGEYYGKESFSYTFPINKESRMYNRFNHDHTGKITFGSPSTPFLFVQGMAGSYVKFDFSDKITAWKNTLEQINTSQEKYCISSIELVFEADTFTKEHHALYMPKLSDLYIFEKDETGKLVIPKFTDSFGNQVNAFIRPGASYNAQTNQFVFKMKPEYFIKVAKNEIVAKPFYLRGLSPEFNCNRIVLINSQFPDKKPRVIIKYVKYNIK